MEMKTRTETWSCLDCRPKWSLY